MARGVPCAEFADDVTTSGDFWDRRYRVRMLVPVAGLSPWLLLSALTGAGRVCVLGSGAARWKGVPARNRRGLSDLRPQQLPRQGLKDSPPWMPKRRSEPRSYITSPKLAATLAQILQEEDGNPHQLFLECNPGEPVVDCISNANLCWLPTGCCLRPGPLKRLAWTVLTVTP